MRLPISALIIALAIGCGPTAPQSTESGANSSALGNRAQPDSSAAVVNTQSPPKSAVPTGDPIAPTYWTADGWFFRVGRPEVDLKNRRGLVSEAELGALGVAVPEPKQWLFRAGEKPCLATVGGFELYAPDPSTAPIRDGVYDETEVRARLTGCDLKARPTEHAWVVAEKYLAAQSPAEPWKLVEVRVQGSNTFDANGHLKPIKRRLPLPKVYRDLPLNNECRGQCVIAWTVLTLPTSPSLEIVTITGHWPPDDENPDFPEPKDLAQAAFTIEEGRRSPIALPSFALVGAFVIGEAPQILLFTHDAGFSRAEIKNGSIVNPVKSYVHEVVGY